MLTKDRKLRYRPREIAAIRRHRVRAFVLTRGNLRAAEQARRFIGNAERIQAACEARGPFVYAVHERRIERLYPE